MGDEHPKGSIGKQPSAMTTEVRQPSESVQLGLRQLGWVALGGSLVSAVAGVVAVYWLLPKELQSDVSDVRKVWYCLTYFSTSFMANLAAAGCVYLLSSKWIRRWTEIQTQQLAESFMGDFENRLRSCVSDCFPELNTGGIREHRSVDKVDWDEVILSAEEAIDICVQGWDGLVRHHSEAWAEFFKKEGQVNLFLPFVPENIEESKTLTHMADRLERTQDDQAHEIRATHRELEKIRNSCNAGKVNHYTVEKMMWYCLIRVDKRVAYLSPYQNVKASVGKSPVFEMRLDRFQATRRWIDKEINGLRPSPILPSVRRAMEAEGGQPLV